VRYRRKRAIAELMATLALLGVTIGLSGGLAFTYYSWLHSYSAQSSQLGGQASVLSSIRVALVASRAGPPAQAWMMNWGDAPLNVTDVFAGGFKLPPGGWSLSDAASGLPSPLLLPGGLYVLSASTNTSLVVYFDGVYRMEVRLAP
jgi:hypothetical protein